MNLASPVAMEMNALTQPRAELRVGPDGAPPEIRKAAEEFEAVFLSTMFDQMFSQVKVDPPFGGGQGERIFRSLMNQELSKSLAGSGGIGIADSVAREILKMQEDAQ